MDCNLWLVFGGKDKYNPFVIAERTAWGVHHKLSKNRRSRLPIEVKKCASALEKRAALSSNKPYRPNPYFLQELS
jgi:hypothetical protein